jgi:Mg2+-importing ATPase
MSRIWSTFFSKSKTPAVPKQTHKTTISKELLESGRADVAAVLQKLRTQTNGLTPAEARSRLKQYGPNEIAKEKGTSALMRLISNFKNPLVILLFILGVVSYVTGDMRATIMILAMVLMGVFLRFFQELRSDKAAEKLKRMVRTVVDVLRAGEKKEIPLKGLVPGDIILLSAGDMVPADVRLISAKDLHINQAALTGEALPVPKSAEGLTSPTQDPLEMTNICFLGSNVEVGSATAVVVVTGSNTFLGSLATSLAVEREATAFDRGINKFSWLMIQFIMVMVPLVFLLNGFSKGNWLEAFLFAMAVAVGLTPEMLPMIVAVNLSKGAISMSRKKVIIKRLNAIQNFGAMDVLCTDKTGTLTQGKIVLVKHLDVDGNENDQILSFGFLNSYFQTGLKNLMDVAVLNHTQLEKQLIEEEHYKKIDEIPFDFVRRRMSVVVEDSRNRHILICKGAVEEILGLSTGVEIQGKVLVKDTVEHHTKTVQLVQKLNEEGFRVIALAYKIMAEASKAYAVEDETDMVLLGFLAFLDPPKETTKEALETLRRINVDVKILTGDNDVVTLSICRQVGLPIDHVLLGHAVEEMTDPQLADASEEATVFAKLSPAHKERIIRALRERGHVVGFLGDGINDAPALKAADVGISVNSAVDIAKESSDIILLKQSLLVLQEGVMEGRRVFGNIIKYTKMAASSNFGNMFSVVGASIFLPFLPMLPLQVLANNLLYDLSQTTIPTDNVDSEWLMKPRKWAIGEIRRFILFIGPISSVFDYATFFIMLYSFKSWTNGALFHTGWFIESLFTQTLIIHVIRTNKIPFIQSRASLSLIVSSLVIVAFGAWLPSSFLAGALGFVPLPLLYWPLLAGILLCYMVLTQLIKTWFIRRYGID